MAEKGSRAQQRDGLLADASLIVGAFASWHVRHDAARRLLDDGAKVVAEAALDSYLVLTSLPPPHRCSPHLVRTFVRKRFQGRYVVLDAVQYERVVAGLTAQELTTELWGDALLGFAAKELGAVLLTCDERAAEAYEEVGADYRMA